MRKAIVTTAAMMACTAAAAADKPPASSGAAALALAALVGNASPAVAAADKRLLAAMLDGRLPGKAPPGRKIIVRAEAVMCRTGNVDITAHDCALTFGGTRRTLKGRAAHDLFATLLENNAPADGAAGSQFASVKALDCAVAPDVVALRNGGGADCAFAPGP